MTSIASMIGFHHLHRADAETLIFAQYCVLISDRERMPSKCILIQRIIVMHSALG